MCQYIFNIYFMVGYIYGLKCPIRNEIVYVGQTHNELEVRLTKHISNTRSKIKYNRTFNKKDHWIKKLIRLGIEANIEIMLIEECELSIIDDREIYWISEYRKYDFNKNLADGGRVNRGHRWTDEAKKRVSESRKGKYVGIENHNYGKSPSEEVKEKISEKLKAFYSEHDANFKGRKHTEESLLKISKNRKGKCCGIKHFSYGKNYICSEETRRKISESNKGKKNPCSEETKKKISEANSGEKNGMFGKSILRTEEQKKKLSESLKNSDKLKKAKQNPEYKKKLSDHFSIPILLLDLDFKIIEEFKNLRECSEKLGCTKGNVKNAINDLRKLCKKFWIVRKENYEDNINKIKEKLII